MPETGNTLEKLRMEERAVRRSIILDAAVRLFARLPFREVGIRDIAAEAGMSPASIYRYFSDRDDLFVEAFVRESEAVLALLSRQCGADRPVDLEAFADLIVSYLLDHDTFFQMMIHFMASGEIRPETLRRFNDAQRRLLDIVATGFVNRDDGAIARMEAHAFFACLNGVLITFHHYPGRTSEETRKHILRLAGLVARRFSESEGA